MWARNCLSMPQWKSLECSLHSLQYPTTDSMIGSREIKRKVVRVMHGLVHQVVSRSTGEDDCIGFFRNRPPTWPKGGVLHCSAPSFVTIIMRAFAFRRPMRMMMICAPPHSRRRCRADKKRIEITLPKVATPCSFDLLRAGKEAR